MPWVWKKECLLCLASAITLEAPSMRRNHLQRFETRLHGAEGVSLKIQTKIIHCKNSVWNTYLRKLLTSLFTHWQTLSFCWYFLFPDFPGLHAPPNLSRHKNQGTRRKLFSRGTRILSLTQPFALEDTFVQLIALPFWGIKLGFVYKRVRSARGKLHHPPSLNGYYIYTQDRARCRRDSRLERG